MATRDGVTGSEDPAQGTNLDPAMADALAAREAARRREAAAESGVDAGATSSAGESSTVRSTMRVDESSVLPSLPDTADEESPAGTDSARGGGLLAGAVLPETGNDAPGLPPPADLGIDPGATFLDRDLDVRLPDLDATDGEDGVNTEGPADIAPAPDLELGPDAPTVDMDLDVRLPGGQDTGDSETDPGSADQTGEDAIDVGVDAPEDDAGAEAVGDPGGEGGDPISPGDMDGGDSDGTVPEGDGPGQGHAYGRDRDDDHGRGQGHGRGHDDQDDASGS